MWAGSRCKRTENSKPFVLLLPAVTLQKKKVSCIAVASLVWTLCEAAVFQFLYRFVPWWLLYNIFKLFQDLFYPWFDVLIHSKHKSPAGIHTKTNKTWCEFSSTTERKLHIPELIIHVLLMQNTANLTDSFKYQAQLCWTMLCTSICNKGVCLYLPHDSIMIQKVTIQL